MSSKLLEFQRKVEAISKDKENPYYKSKYFDINSLLETVKPILNELDLILLQPLTYISEGMYSSIDKPAFNISPKPALRTIVLDSESGSVLIESIIPLPENTDPQKMGGVITYYRRYAIQSLLCLQAEDDDAESVVHGKEKQLPTVANVIKKIKNCKFEEDLIKANKWATAIGYNKNQVNVILRAIEEKEKDFNK